MASWAAKTPVGPNDHVNTGQSSNDTFPTAMHLAALTKIDERLVPSVTALHDEIADKSAQRIDVVKIGRTYLEDAVRSASDNNGQAGLHNFKLA